MLTAPLKILSVSDVTVSLLHSQQVKDQMKDVSLILDCGDLPYAYSEYILDALNLPLLFVRGNHSKITEHASGEILTRPRGAIDLHRKCVQCCGLLIAGVEGSLRYRPGPFQYSQMEMWLNVFSLVPALLINRLRYGRYLDIFVTHAPPHNIHDQDDLPHQGISAFRWFDAVFQPVYHFHGHIHVYHPDTIIETAIGKTCVINTYGYRVTEFQR